MVYLLITLLMLTLIAFVHELGHFTMAKFFKVPVSEFSLGMGPKLFSKKKNETVYSLRALPIGGFVNIDGMEPDNEMENGFNTKKPYQKFIILVAGVFMNFVLAYIILFFMAIFIGELKPNNNPIVGNVSKDSSVYSTLKKGDRIISIDNEKVETWDDIIKKLSIKKSDVNLIISRNNKIIKIKGKMKYNENAKRYLLGISGDVINVKYGIGQSFIKAGDNFIKVFDLTFKGLKMLVAGKVKSNEIAGPVGVVKVVKTFSAWGVSSLIFLIALLSVNIGIVNLFPLPALDGGRIIFVILEGLGMKVNRTVEENIHKVGFILLLSLIVLLTFNDIKNIFIK
ncbi:RIP metalloprotease RseP [Haliovirga abyssi]|uniref:Zinc metalloprotease n=1 Tax=Haliovirga abyssi TaxID=2996794 RepID=A0AAU9DUH6_9FUSO|nr:RIP metalloprotease RseP [Haliovirga abyssi]BDU49621.1 putative zinc metalloprotease [Haliovirga abyssi]